MQNKKILNQRAILRIWLGFEAIALVIGFLVRIALLCNPMTQTSTLTFGQIILAFLLGAINDASVMSVMVLPLWAFMLSSGHWKYRKPQVWAFLAILVGGWFWLKFGCAWLHEFNSRLTDVICWIVVYWAVVFSLRAFVPRMRQGWMRTWMAIILFVYLTVLILNIFGEWLFWDEFGVRYNFIAVDYLIYTSEVVGNIMQSYSMGWILSIVALVAGLLEWWLFGWLVKDSAQLYHSGWRLQSTWVLLPAIAGVGLLTLTEKAQDSDNAYYNELQANGAYSFVRAFMKNDLDYKSFYLTIPDDQARVLLQQQLGPVAKSECDTLRPNIVLVTMESMSADYMKRFGNKKQLTPVLDSLWSQSLAFDNMFAAGNRTVRGLEAVTLSRPPAPGESVIKRPEMHRYHSIADKLREMGYDCSFYYGGDAYFDNMESFFSAQGYKIKDKKTMNPDEITSQTIWGVCDGDVYRRLLADLDSAYATGDVVFAHLMTTSNHRPYIYPDGCVSIPPSTKSREGAVMYSDYALGEFLRDAKQKAWFDNTVFVIVADHCAMSAGRTELPLGNYHIPCLIYSPSIILPQVVDKVSSQIDVMPTLMARLGWQLDSALYGRDVLDPNYCDRAYLATYQDLGYYNGRKLTVLSPGRKSRQFDVSATADDPYCMSPLSEIDSVALRRAIAVYQVNNE